MRTKMMFTQFGITMNDRQGGMAMVKELQRLSDEGWQLHSWHTVPLVLPSKLEGVVEVLFTYHYVFTKLELPGIGAVSSLPKAS